MLYQNGEMIASDSYLTLHTYPYPYGQPTVRLSHKAPQEMAALKLILDYMRWSGPCQADFLYDEARNESFLIDVNPRFWGSVGQSIARGIDFPYYYYKCAIGKQDLQVPIDPPVVATRWLGGDLMRKANHFFYNTEEVSRSRVGMPTKYAAMDDFEFGDPLPFVGWCASQLRRKFKSFIGFGSHRDALEGVWK
jgi:predicted ATP-grasp superfamily ATP-dependent carboligase